jgi:predicted DCC family thiol-disulfide oxidoreductase YuxK
LIHNISTTTNLETVYLIQENYIYDKSVAVLKILMNCGFFFKLTSIILQIIPTVIRDFCYNFISKNRHKMFKNKCAIINQKDLKRIVF